MPLHLSRRVLHRLRASLERDTGAQAAAYLQEAGFAGGEELYHEFAAWLQRTHGVDQPAALDAEFLGKVLGMFFTECGWGSLAVTQLSPAVLALDTADWAEASDDLRGEFPSCHVTCGLLADFFGRIAESPVAVMEVACRSHGDTRCRFLVGAPETLGALYDRMTAGKSYSQAIGVATR